MIACNIPSVRIDSGGRVSVRKINILVVVIAVALINVLFAAPVRANETVKFDCTDALQKLDISVDDQEKVTWEENSNKAFKIEFDKPSTVNGRLSPFKSCFIFCSQKKKISHDSAKKGNKIRVKKKHEGKYNYTIHCDNGVKIDPMIQVPRVMVPQPH